jgi:ribulose-bisphosphate carboxylase large chain
MDVFMSYVNLKHKPSKKNFICEYYVEPATRQVLEDLPSESSIGTWTEVKTMKKNIQRLGATVFSVRKNIVRVEYPSELFEPGNIPQLLSDVAGNIFGMKVLKNLRLLDINFPDSYIKKFKGPKFGIPGVRKVLKIKDRPLVGAIIKPKVGLNPKQHAKVAYEAWVGGCDVVKDDENLTDHKFNPFRKRITETLKMRAKAERETGERKAYMPNVTAPYEEMLKRAEFVKAHIGRYAMIDIVTCGFSALQSFRDQDLGLIIHAHRAMHATLTRNKKHGISMLLLAKLARLAGVDQLHIGTVVGKMEGGREEVMEIEGEIEKKIIQPKNHVLTENWLHIKPVFAVSSGGLHPGHVPKLVQMLGRDIIIQMGGGIHGHPSGTKAGARAARQAVEATIKNVSLREYSKYHKELNLALQRWK